MDNNTTNKVKKSRKTIIFTFYNGYFKSNKETIVEYSIVDKETGLGIHGAFIGNWVKKWLTINTIMNDGFIRTLYPAKPELHPRTASKLYKYTITKFEKSGNIKRIVKDINEKLKQTSNWKRIILS